MASSAIHGGGERDFTVADTAVFALDDGRHGNRIPALLWQEDRRMTIGAGQPLCVGQMGKTYIRHGSGVFEDDVEIDWIHDTLAVFTHARFDQVLIKRLDPVDNTCAIPRKTLHPI